MATAEYRAPTARRRIEELGLQWQERALAEDAWPFTYRALPWCVAGFILMTCWVPFDAIKLHAGGPIDLTLDRIVLAPIALVWVASMLAGGHKVQMVRFGPLGVAVVCLLLVGVASIMVNYHTLQQDSELSTSIKRCAFVASYGLIFAIVATSVRRKEVMAFLTLYVLAATVTALGVIIEYRTRTNVFYNLADHIFKGPFSVAAKPVETRTYERQLVVGPTGHPLAVTMLLAFALPFAVTGIARHRTGIKNLAYIAITAILLAGAASTLRKSALVVPGVSMLILALCLPRRLGRLLPVAVVVIIAIQGLAPSALSGIKSQVIGHPLNAQASVQGRTADYDAVGPDIWAEPFLGRGVGSYVPTTYRYIDNQYLLSWLDTGILGVGAYFGVLIAMLLVTRRLLRSATTDLRITAAALAAASVGYFVASALFDILAFNHAPYVFFMLAGLAVAASPETRPERWAIGRPRSA